MVIAPTPDALLALLAELDSGLRLRFVPRRPDLAAELRDLAEVAEGMGSAGREWDRYGASGPVAALERRVADLLGQPEAAFFPSGVMAQQAALRTWCDRMGSRRVAMPDLSHLLVHEEDGPRRLHGFAVEHLTTGPVTPTRAHVEALPGRLGAVLVELPLRDAGYLLPPWEELVDVAAACRERAIPLHLDGARLWESAPYWDRPLREICALADSTYVSFYKGLGGLAGACLAGPEDVVAEARLWRRRHGGTLFTLAPYAVAAWRGLDRHLPRMGECHAYAVALAAALAERGFRVFPEPVQATAFRVFAPLPPGELLARAVRLAREDSLGVPAQWRAAEVPGWSFTEVTVTPAMVEAWGAPDRPGGAADALARLL